MTTYTNVFGGGVVNPADISYIGLSFSVNTTLVWPLENADNSNVATAQIDATPAGGGLTLTLPDATLVSVGQSIYLKNKGGSSFTLASTGGASLGVIATTTTYLVQLIDNTTVAGTWNVTAVGTSSPALPSALAGPGLEVVGSTLGTIIAVDDRNAAYAISAGDQSVLQNWTGGTDTITFPAVTTLGASFAVPIRNSGTGTLTLATTGADTIDGLSSITLAQGESGWFTTDGISVIVSIGRGQTDLQNITYTTISLTGLSVKTLSATEAAYSIIEFTGALSSDCTVTFPSGTPARWFIRNNTTGAYSVFLTVSGSGTTLTVPAGQNITIWSDAANARNAVTVVPTQAGRLDWFIGTTAPTGYVIAAGGTIGSAASAAATRANSDTLDLYTVLWDACPDTICPVSTGRGGSAAADFAADKTLQLIDLRGRATVGLDNAGGTAANVAQHTTNLTTNGTTTATVASAAGLAVGMYVVNSNVAAGTTITVISGTTLTLSGAATGSGTTSGRFSFFTDAQQVGSSGGADTQTLSIPQMPTHDHQGNPGQFTLNFNATAQAGAGANIPNQSSATTATTGGGQPHPNMQPSMIALPCLKL